MAKVRVYELARELGVDSRVLMMRLTELGAPVRSASSPIEPDVVRRLRAESSRHLPPVSSQRGEPPRPNPFAVEHRLSPYAERERTGSSAGGQHRNPFASRRTPNVRPRPAAGRPDPTTRALHDAELVFGARAVQATGRTAVNGRETYADGYGWQWQQKIIDHDTYVELQHVGIEPHESELAYESLIAGLRPADLITRLGDRTVLEWLRAGEPAQKVANTLQECRRDPKSRRLIGGERSA